MKKWNTAALFVIGLISTAAHALDLTPLEITISNDGPPATRYFFQDEGKRLSYRIDNKMTVKGASAAVAFGFSDIDAAEMKWSKSPVRPILPFDEKHLEAYRQAARTFFPHDAIDIQLEEEKPEAIAINGWTSQQFIFSYKMFGVARRRAVTFVNLRGQEQVVVEISAPTAGYEKAYARGYRVLNSISELPVMSRPGPT
jgi:hypothetical protein